MISQSYVKSVTSILRHTNLGSLFIVNQLFSHFPVSRYQLKNLASNYIRSELQMFNQHLGSRLELQIGVGNFNEQVLKSRL